jgi:recombination protein RecA
MARPIDISKFRKGITKSIPGISAGFHDPDTWISTGNFALNYLISSDFNKGIPLGKVSMFSGQSGAGKSYIVSGNIVKDAQRQGIYCIVMDTENALDEAWLHDLGVDTSEDKLLKLNVSQINDAAQIINDFVKEYKQQAPEDRQKILFVIDSIGMMSSAIGAAQFEKNEMKGDFGSKPKELMALVRNCLNMFGDLNIGLVCTNHSYSSQDQFSPDDKISGGSGPVYASSIVIAMKQLKLKEDAEGNKVSDVQGIRAACKVMKTRFNKPFEDIELQIPYDQGMSPYSGFFDLIEKKKLITRDGNRYVYVDLSGEVHKYFRKEWSRNENGIMDLVMSEFHEKNTIIEKSTELSNDTNGE